MNYGLARNLKLSFLKVWGCNAYVKKFQPDKLKPKSEKCVFIGYPKEKCWVHLLSQIRRQIRCWEWILSREGVSLERSEWEESRKLDKVIVPSPLLESRSSRNLFLWLLHQLVRKLMMMIMKLQIKLLPNLVGKPEWDPHQSRTVILFWKSCY